MEKIPTKDLQVLANMLHEEGNASVRAKMAAVIESINGNPEHANLSNLLSVCEQSSIKGKIHDWVSNLTTPKPEFFYVPDIPAQMIEQPEDPTPEEPVTEELTEEAPEEKPKKTRKKKED